MHARAPPVEDFQPGQESERIGKGKGEVREGKVRAVDREVREEGKGEERDGRAAQSMILGVQIVGAFFLSSLEQDLQLLLSFLHHFCSVQFRRFGTIC